jgi:hypothetical protein
MSDGEGKNSDIETKIRMYIDNRLGDETNKYLGYYNRKAAQNKRYHLYSRSVAALGAVLIPVVSNIVVREESRKPLKRGAKHSG